VCALRLMLLYAVVNQVMAVQSVVEKDQLCRQYMGQATCTCGVKLPTACRKNDELAFELL